ncbi:NHL repeat-containing protein 2 [Chionoecetes opilio]|uniref:NHL repeat-containing protein 2 n=1 Tax=Chionoecetes opilio TaxID=41210 RepID=A0A8J4Y991_CHIOP|nr:NHL repeat-containing protein 2 [Chionoecetes opilio]
MEGPAQNVSELTLVCIELATKLEDMATLEEREACIVDHIAQYTREKVHMVDFDSGLEWFNVAHPLTVSGDLQGRITVLDFFTYCCINCMHILPDLEALEALHPPSDGEVLVVGVHSAKFENERVSENIVAAMKRYGIHHPVVNDPQAKMWLALAITCWPTLLLLGPSGEPLFVLVGEGHRDRLQLYVNTALKHFSDAGRLKGSPVPLAPSEHCRPSNSILRFPGKVAIHPEGVIVSDSGHHRLLITDHQGNVMQVVGCGESGHQDGHVSSAKFNNPQGAVYLHPDTIIVADTGNHLIRKVDIGTGSVSTIAGTGVKGTDHEGGNIGTAQAIASPWDVCVTRSLDRAPGETDNMVLVAMAGTHQIWGVFLTAGKWIKGSCYEEGTVVRLAGSGAEENRNTSYPIRAGFAQPSGLTCCSLPDRTELFVADAESSSIRKYDLKDGSVKAVVGGARDPLDLFAYGDVDGRGVEAKLQHPMAVTSVGHTVYVADSYNSKIKVVRPSGKTYTVSTVFGSASTDTEAPLIKGRLLNEPAGVCGAADGSCLYIADTNNHAIKILSLADHSLSEFAVSMVDEGDSASQDLLNGNLKTEEMDEVVVSVPREGAEEIILQIQLNFPEGASLNDSAPNQWTVESHEPSLVPAATRGSLQQGSQLKLCLPAAARHPSCDFTLSCRVFPCLATGVCVAAVTAACVVRLTYTKEESSVKKEESSVKKEVPVNVKLKL